MFQGTRSTPTSQPWSNAQRVEANPALRLWGVADHGTLPSSSPLGLKVFGFPTKYTCSQSGPVLIDAFFCKCTFLLVDWLCSNSRIFLCKTLWLRCKSTFTSGSLSAFWINSSATNCWTASLNVCAIRCNSFVTAVELDSLENADGINPGSK